jgi:cytoskeleton protein RodZ
MTNVGETLRRERLRRGMNLDEVARDIKIRPKLLEYIEAEQFDRLPGGVFAKSFVKQYAMALGLDGDEFAAEVQRQIHPPLISTEPRPVVPAVTETTRTPAWETIGADHKSTSPWGALAGVVVVVLGCSIAYNWWVSAQSQPQTQTVASAARESAAPPEAGQPAQQAIEAAPPVDTPSPNPAVPVYVTLSASEDTWVSAVADGEERFAAILGPNETRTVEAQSGVRLVVGNAGGLTVNLNGKPIGELGPRGQVRIVNLTPNGAEIQSKSPAAVEAAQDIL